jgi:ATP-binding cassette subfamily C (CFTR/MRP) protein 1
VLNKLSLAVKPNEHLAITGRSGSGKSSLLLALLRMINTPSGTIMIDGTDVSALPGEHLRTCLNVVPQDPLLIPATMRFNIDPMGTASDAEILRALARVKLDTIVQEQGGLDREIDTAAWSAGQKQLLCFARAIVRKSRILILDEASSSVDTTTQALMQDIIDTEFKSCTVLAVIHRLDHIASYDKVALLDAGQLIEYGSPEVLLGGETRFKELYAESRR